MKTLFRSMAVCLIASLAACSKKDPAHPNAGLKIYSGGNLESSGGFHMKPGSGISPKEMSFAKDGHKFSVTWTVSPKTGSDLYHLKMTVDGGASTKEVEFRGEPIVILEQPFRVVMENVDK